MPSCPSLQSLLRISNNRSPRQDVLTLLFLFTLLIIYCTVYLLSVKEGPSPQLPPPTLHTMPCRNNQTMPRRTHRWPKIIHQTWKSKNVPKEYKDMQESCIQQNPGYTYMLWTDEDLENLIREHYPWFLKTYLSYPYTIERIDSARLFIVHRHGGVYLDIDITCKVPLQEIEAKLMQQTDGINADVVLAQTDPLGVTNNILMSQPDTRFLDFVTHRLEETKGYYFSPHWTVMFTAGPIFLYRSYLQYPCKEEVHLISPHEHGTLYFDHKQARTWHRWDGPIITWFDYHGRTLLKILAVVIVVLVALALFRRCRRPIAETITQTHKRWSSADSDTWVVTYDVNNR